MPESFFSTIIIEDEITAGSFLIATVVSILLGLFLAVVYMKCSTYSRSFVITLVVLPVIVQLVIMLVNGNIGAGVAVAGAFSLVRFRSAAGSGEEIAGIFLAMAVGLATGMGYIGIAVIFTVIVALVFFILNRSGFGERGPKEQLLRITIPESLDFEGVFDDLFAKYTSKAELLDVRTSDMGSLYKLSYRIILRDNVSQKAMIDELRTRNGNLEISCSRPVSGRTEEL